MKSIRPPLKEKEEEEEEESFFSARLKRINKHGMRMSRGIANPQTNAGCSALE
jgi:hypothetical protein